MAYNGRRGPNVSEYIANLNAIPTPQELQAQENLNFEDDLALFTNTQFFDFDLGQDADLQQQTYERPSAHNNAGSRTSAETLDLKPLHYQESDFGFPEFNFGSHQASPFTQPTSIPAPIQTHQPYFSGPSAGGSPNVEPPTPTSATAAKRKASTPAESLEDSSRAAAEEDKRRRNTAASARFRVKKKQREQALEKSAKEMSDKVAALEGRINQLETENKWLKNLVTEKNESKEDIAALWKKYSSDKEREVGNLKDGVGTKA